MKIAYEEVKIHRSASRFENAANRLETHCLRFLA
jgi:hypothetical protein